MLKVGRAERTHYAVATHTGGVAGDPGLASELFRAHHAIEVSDLVEFTEAIAASQSTKGAAGRRLGVITSSGGLAELILDIAASSGLELPPLSAEVKAEIERRIGFVSGDGNPLDAWGNGTFVSNLPVALAAFDRSPDHDIVVFCRDNCDGQPFESPEVGWAYLELFERAAASSSKPHYLLHTRPGLMNREQVAHLRNAGIAVVGGLREGLGAIDRLAPHATTRGG